MGLMSGTPKKGFGILYLPNEIIVCTYDLPNSDLKTGERINLTIYPTITPDGNFDRNPSRRIITLETAHIFQHAMMSSGCAGIPKTGLLVYKHPDSVLLKGENQSAQSEISMLREAIQQRDRHIAMLSRDLNLIRAEPEKAMIRAADVIGTQTKKARAYSQNQPVLEYPRRRPPLESDGDNL